MAEYKVRKACNTETGDGKGFHYFYDTQVTLDDTIECSTHTETTYRDFVVEEKTPPA